ncbi:radical SAM protein [Rhodovarius crocodyli]|uniref:Radical SAM protein n=1 Tax=Rhodovarius crocodyli TaxID=1979269 RepID=A0A437MF42_9PROT|nr:radical SAM protein [Rhodovarius crocodyli]RVT96278.1 radical SAM protein [Rhodovarius crocodyli]
MWNSIREIQDPAQNVSKFVFTKDTAVAEAVLYRYPDYATRTVICCSTMSGCPMGCRFCGAGDFFARSLSAEEIVAQVEHCIAETGVAPAEMKRLQIMFMSMGEPLLNLAGLIPAIERLYAMYPSAALLISTSAPDIGKAFADVVDISVRVPTVGLQFSVHESTDEARDKLIPFQRKLGLWDIALRGAEWAQATGRRPFFNYCAHDENSADIDAERLAKLFHPTVWNATVSVVCERSEGLPATNEHQRRLATGFGDKLLGLGFDVRVFDPAGQDTIGGGCGQLWFVQEWANQNPDQARRSIGFGRPEVHAPVATAHA